MLFLLTLALAEDLIVSSDLEGAPIFINGADTGFTTPATIPNLRPGKITVTVSQGCRSGRVSMTLSAGKTGKVSVLTLEDQGSVVVYPKPNNAQLLLDGSVISSGTPVPVACGDHTVVANLNGYAQEEVDFTVEGLDPISLPVSLHKLGFGSIELSVTPRGATLTLDGEEVGADVASLPSVAEGEHTIGAQLDGYKPVEQRLRIKPDTSYTYQLKLVVEGGRKDSQVLPYGNLSASAMVKEETPAPRSSPKQAPASAADVELQVVEVEEEPQAEEAQEEPAAEEPEEPAEPEETPPPPPKKSSSRSSERTPSRTPVEELPEADEDIPEDEPDPDVDPDQEEIPSDLDEPGPGQKKKENDGKKHTGLGIGLLGGAVLTGGGTVWAYGSAMSAFERYDAKQQAARKHKDNVALQNAADDYFTEYSSKRTLFYVGTGLTVALLGGGVASFFVDDQGPTFVPTAGGGMFLWTGRF